MIAFLLCKVAFCSVLLLHPVHETYSEIEWNQDSRCCEVAMRIHVLDEQWMRRSIEADIDSGWELDYLRKHVVYDRSEAKTAELTSSDGKPRYTGKPIRWVGRKVEGAYAWWFYEVDCKDGRPPKTVFSNLLFDRESNYHHQFVLLGQKSDTGKDPSTVLSQQHPEKPLKLAVGKEE
ncbi:hypothetical protein LOC67_02505 [Stieleria sp. JC731]|uniref:DUF6702 family protein n=1 Tax=Pirellulaceae TaxID=2691357 RepID=UPI001E5E99E0|nr:DUF6702 family protein [Stieleria sp. JC731]MCC9599416.1 hypothetical protein [Stieleria sp. JC731]